MHSLSLGRGFASLTLLGVSLAVGCESSSSDESSGGAGGAGGETCTMGTSGSSKQECVDPALILGQGGGANDGGGGAAQGGGGAAADGGGGGAAPGTCPSISEASAYFGKTNEFLMSVTANGTSPNADGECCYHTTNTFCH